ncbi:MAG: UDP-3-O-(3-hydroxymyristoyl)glucosamine N-acyltransferase [Alphaproteobacteria bacterium]|nr:UDP-3-O-(3-hydroxymyristoyl)glucosamine N-acyltransferase [Alphaproteobacteria bacterium]
MTLSRFYNVSDGISLAEISDMIGAELEGDGGRTITKLSGLEDADENSVCFFSSAGSASDLIARTEKFKALLKNLKAAACFVAPNDAELIPEGVAKLITFDPKGAFIQLSNFFYRDKSREINGISEMAFVDPTATFKDKSSVHIDDFASIGEGAKIGARVFIASGAKIKAGVEIGDDCDILENAVISHATLGKRVHIGEGANIGGDSFGWHTNAMGHQWVPQIGQTILEDDVWIGANSVVDRGAQGDTVIGRGTKIDSLVMIGHNCKLGENCIVAAMAGIAGSTTIGDWSLIGPKAGINGHLTLGDRVQVGAGAGVIQNLNDGEIVSGYPAQPVADFLKQTAMLRRMIKEKKKPEGEPTAD